MENNPPTWKMVDGQRCLVVPNALYVTGDRKHFSEEEEREVRRILDSYENISWEHLVKETEAIGIGRLHLHAIISQMLDLGEIFEPIMGFVSMTAKARVW